MEVWSNAYEKILWFQQSQKELDNSVVEESSVAQTEGELEEKCNVWKTHFSRSDKIVKLLYNYDKKKRAQCALYFS